LGWGWASTLALLLRLAPNSPPNLPPARGEELRAKAATMCRGIPPSGQNAPRSLMCCGHPTVAEPKPSAYPSAQRRDSEPVSGRVCCADLLQRCLLFWGMVRTADPSMRLNRTSLGYRQISRPSSATAHPMSVGRGVSVPPPCSGCRKSLCVIGVLGGSMTASRSLPLDLSPTALRNPLHCRSRYAL
jgi:hypothetical protein